MCTLSEIYKDQYSEVFIFIFLECMYAPIHLGKDDSLFVDTDILCLP